MSPPSINWMTDAEINIIIAEACGWRARKNYGAAGGCLVTGPNVCYDDVALTEEEAIARNCPRYTTSLDAMREAESEISGSFSYIGSIAHESILKELGPNKPAFATAIQRARAVVIAIGRAKL